MKQLYNAENQQTPERNKRSKIIAFYFSKGGVGKSRLAILLANYYAAIGKKVCVIDIDSSTHSSTDYYNIEENIEKARKSHNVAKLMFDTENELDDFALTTNHENIFLVPSSRNLSSMRTMNENTFRKILSKPNSFDFIILDCPPAYDNFAINAIRAADKTISPCLQDNDSFGNAVSLFGDYQNEIEDKLDDWYLIVNGYNKQFADAVTGKQQEYISRYEEYFGNHLVPRECWLPWTKDMNNIRDRGLCLSKTKIRGTVCNENLFNAIKNLAECFVDEDKIAEPEKF